MKLEKVAEKKNPEYPSFDDHRIKRRGALKVMLGGLIAAFAAGCNFRPVSTGGVVIMPEHPEAEPVKPAEKLPLEQPAGIEGDMISPVPPKQPDPPPNIRGRMVPVQPPLRTKGRMAPVKPPKK